MHAVFIFYCCSNKVEVQRLNSYSLSNGSLVQKSDMALTGLKIKLSAGVNKAVFHSFYCSKGEEFFCLFVLEATSTSRLVGPLPPSSNNPAAVG